MEKFSSKRFYQIATNLEQIKRYHSESLQKGDFAYSLRNPANEQVDYRLRKGLESYLQPIRNDCASIGLRISVKCVADILTKLRGHLTNQELVSHIDHLDRTIKWELEDNLFMFIAPNKADFYKQDQPLFGNGVKSAFPSVNLDVEEAGKSYACGRNTACVFHLMRVMEVGLRIVGNSLADPSLDPSRNPTWENILQRCDKELAKPLSQRSPEWQSSPEFFSDAAANLRAVKNAWRNPTIHPANFYDDEKALEILNAVKGLMRHLATKLHE